MKCEYCETTEDVHTLVDQELGPDLHICRRCWERGEEERLSQPLSLKPVETPYFQKMPRKKWDTSVYLFKMRSALEGFERVPPPADETPRQFLQRMTGRDFDSLKKPFSDEDYSWQEVHEAGLEPIMARLIALSPCPPIILRQPYRSRGKRDNERTEQYL